MLNNSPLPNTLNSDQSGHEVDKTAPTVARFAFTSSGPYMAGDTITLAVTFSEAVTITRTGTGTPYTIIRIGSASKRIVGSPGATAKTTHEFNYTVQSGDSDSDGVSIPSASQLILTISNAQRSVISDAVGNTLSNGAALPDNLATSQSGHIVDNAAPTVSSFRLTSTGPYRQGSVITLQVTFNEAVTVGSGTAASIPITIGSNARAATATATNTASLTQNFTYTVTSLDADSDGISVASSAVLTNPGRIMDTASNAMTATALPDNLNSNQGSSQIVQPDETPPTIASISFASSGPYKTGAVVMLQVAFSEPVVIGSSNLPAIPLQIGSNSRPATAAAAATASRTHNFNYTLGSTQGSADADNDGIQVLTAAVLSNPRHHKRCRR